MDNKLSTTLNNHDVQNLAYAVRVYLDPGKLGFYDRVLETFICQIKAVRPSVLRILGGSVDTRPLNLVRARVFGPSIS
jgi:hypothetical protein